MTPLIVTHPDDHVGVVGVDGGLPADTHVGEGLVLTEWVPQAHKVALRAIAKGQPVRRYNVVIGYAHVDIRPGEWVLTKLPAQVRWPAASVTTSLRMSARISSLWCTMLNQSTKTGRMIHAARIFRTFTSTVQVLHRRGVACPVVMHSPPRMVTQRTLAPGGLKDMNKP